MALVAGCAHRPATAAPDRTAALAAALRAAHPAGASDPAVAAEAERLAALTTSTVARLRQEFRPVGSANMNNVLVHLRLRPRGLCFHWANDLLEALETSTWQYYSIHWATSYLGDPWKEHNALVAVPAGQPFARGLLLDAWRHRGELFWTIVSEDRPIFAWREMPPEELALYRESARRR